MLIPYDPLRFESSVPVYSSNDILKYGVPDHYNIIDYIVIDMDPSPLDYYKCTDKKILPYHHYNRKERFRLILGYLLGKGQVPFEIFELVLDQITYVDEDYIWHEIQDILGKSGNCKFTNRIPRIMIMLDHGKCFETTREEFIIERFNLASERFDYLKSRNLLEGRTYFPNLRYVAFRLLAEHEANFKIKVPLLKTKTKLQPMDEMYRKIFL